MIIKTTKLTGKALDWAVGVAIGYSPTISGGNVIVGNEDERGVTHMVICEPTTNWGQLGPILSECMHYCKRGAVVVVGVQVKVNESLITAHGSAGDLETAACRAIVAAKLGDTVDVPEVLV